ncbi:hypothetical protein FDB53_17225 [Clostridium botulinum]|uniref:hypothetical protein n=1 Tax=Clostridium botulinum TaxID=1491 RepID=UPI000773E8C6|nr:hypothetical protein [Clostridium botulinum]NFN46909.1 hypothetical protein [Clostridium botulinum]
MDRKEFDNLTIDNQIEFINTRLEQHNTLTKVCDLEDLRRNTVRDRFQSHGYKLVKGQFIKVTDSEIKLSPSITKVHKNNTINKAAIPYDENTIKMIKALKKELDQLKGQVQELKNNSPIQSNTNLTLMPFNGLSENKSYRVDSKVSKEFNSFCKKHKEYKKQDLLSQAIQEFIDRYK